MSFVLSTVTTTTSWADHSDIESPTLVSVSITGTGGHRPSYNPVISEDGRYVAFQSLANNLIKKDFNFRMDVFVRDLHTGATIIASGVDEKAIGNQKSDLPSISADGRFVSFRSGSHNLVPDDTNGIKDIFVFDRVTKTTKIVSVSSNGEQANSASRDHSLSSDGRYIVFRSSATNLDNKEGNIFIRDQIENKTVGLGVYGYCYICSNFISGDGRYVTFGSLEKLTNEETSSEGDIFVYDREKDKTKYVSTTIDGIQLNAESEIPSISLDGRYISFISESPNLVDNDQNGNEPSVFVKDMFTGKIDLVSIDEKGQALSPTPLTAASISGDGRFVVFSDERSIFVHDRKTATTTSLNVAGKITSISADGKIVAFDTNESLVEQDTNQYIDVYVTKLKLRVPELEKNLSIPSWIKFNAKFWSDREIDDSSFLNGIEWLIANEIMIIPESETEFSNNTDSKEIPDWIRKNAGWWAEGLITDRDFVQGIGWLIPHGILRI